MGTPGQTPEDQARWLPELAYKDRAQMAEADWLNLQEEIGVPLQKRRLAAYERKFKAKHGPNVKVRRRVET